MFEKPPIKNAENENKIEITKSNKNKWLPFKDLLIHRGLFKRGIVAVTPKHTSHYGVDENKSFHFKDRQFSFYQLNKVHASGAAPHSGFLSQAKTLLSKLTQFAKSKKIPSANLFGSDDIALFNKRHKEEIFLPFVCDDENQQKVGFYLYPWVSEYNEKIQLSGFHTYHTVGCLFGSALKGMDQYGSIFELIKHDVKFFPNQKIELIIHNPDEPNPYEEMLFNEFRKLVSLMNMFSAPDRQKRLVYHLPFFDYVLFGIELFIAGRITFKALDGLFKEIFSKKLEHTKKIMEICKEYGIEVSIESPFENIFGSLDESVDVTKVIMDKLNLPCADLPSDRNIDQQKEHERLLVKHCLSALRNNSYKPKHQQVWKDFSDINGDKVNNIEALLKMGNSVMVGVACVNENDYEVCSFSPLSEKQIQLEYKEYQEEIQKKQTDNLASYPKAFNITTFDPLITYSRTTMGLPTKDLAFYFNQCPGTLSDLISNKQALNYACKNVGLFANKTKVDGNIFLEKLLAEKAGVEKLNSTTWRVVFNHEQDAKTFQKILMQKGYGESGLSGKPKQIYKLSMTPTKDNNNASSSNSTTAYAIKLTHKEFSEIFPRRVFDQEQTNDLSANLQESAEKPIQLEQILASQVLLKL